VPRALRTSCAVNRILARGAIASADVLLLQLEVPLEASLAAAKLARQAGKTVVLNPAPARELPEALYGLVDVLTPNESETHFLTGVPATTNEGAAEGARLLVDRGVRTALLTLGQRGALLLERGGEPVRILAPEVEALDTTAAGDAFCGALAVALSEGAEMKSAVHFACAAGALACTVMGAGPSLPRRDRIEALLKG
jgi:ribokinase